MVVWLSKCLKEIIQIELNMVKNPNWPAGYLQAWLRIWTRDYREQIQLVVRAGLELSAYALQVQLSNYSATLPLCLLVRFHRITQSYHRKRKIKITVSAINYLTSPQIVLLMANGRCVSTNIF